MTFRLGDTAADVISDGPPRALVLGLGFAQFLVVRTLAREGVSSVVMSDAKRAAYVGNWMPDHIASGAAAVVTNGEGEWEDAASKCTTLVVCPEAADVPGRTVTALLRKMPRCSRLVVVNPAGTTTGVSKEKEGNWLFNNIMMAGGKRVGMAGDNMEYAKSCEEAAIAAVSENLIKDYVIIHRGKLYGGGFGEGWVGLGEDYFRVCGSVPDEVLERTYDTGRVATKILSGDGIDVSPKKKIDMKSEGGAETAFLEEVKDKTHRVALAGSVAAAVTLEDPPSRFSVIISRGGMPTPIEDVRTELSRIAAAV